MRRKLAVLFIVGYLSAVTGGLICQTLQVGLVDNPHMYFLVWDMFMGYGAYEVRHHVIGEGASGAYYELAPGPWGEVQPFGSIGRRHYDVNCRNLPRMAETTLRYTEHEPITRMFIVEECWPRKYNVPALSRAGDRPLERPSYFHVRQVLTPDGEIIRSSQSFVRHLVETSILDNPRLKAESRSGRPVFALAK